MDLSVLCILFHLYKLYFLRKKEQGQETEISGGDACLEGICCLPGVYQDLFWTARMGLRTKVKQGDTFFHVVFFLAGIFFLESYIL